MSNIESTEILNIIFGIVSLIGVGIAIYQRGVIAESKSRREQLQYLMASINSSAIQKVFMWQHQIDLLKESDKEKGREILRLHLLARDGFADLSQQAISLEGVIADESAITKMVEKGKLMAEKANEISDEINR